MALSSHVDKPMASVDFIRQPSDGFLIALQGLVLQDGLFSPRRLLWLIDAL